MKFKTMLVSKESTKDLGRLNFGKPYKFNFTVINEGKFPLEITRIGVGCTSCTKASTNKTKLAPGEDTVIDAVFTPGSIGKQNKYINVQWNSTEVLKLTFTAESYE